MSDFNEELKAYEKRREEKMQDFIRSLTSKLPLFIAIGIALWWIFYGTVEITSSTLTFTDRLALTICTIVMAVTYTSLIAEGGFDSAKKSETYIKEYNRWEDNVKKGNPHKRQIIDYAKDIALGNLYECRKANLESLGLKYNEIFNSNGELIKTDYKKDKLLTRNQKKMIKKCLRIRIIVPTIFGNISSVFFGLKKETTLKEYRSKQTIEKTAIKVVVSIVSVGIMFNFIGFNYGSIIYALFQIVLWSASGVSERLKNYSFIIDNIVPQLQEKSLIIEGYLSLNDIDKNKYIDIIKEEIKEEVHYGY